jgi:hypothetical protein
MLNVLHISFNNLHYSHMVLESFESKYLFKFLMLNRLLGKLCAMLSNLQIIQSL